MAPSETQQLLRQLKQANQKANYWQQVARKTGILRLRETENLSSIIQSLKKTEADLLKEIDRRKRLEKSLVESEERYRSFVQHFQGIAFRGNMDFSPIFFHGDIERITGYTETDFLRGKPKWDKIIHPQDLAAVFTDDEQKLHTTPNYATEREYRVVRKDKEIRWVHEFIQNICDDSGVPILVQGTIYDITARKRDDDRIKASLREKETLLREIYHRTKNNMQVIRSMLNLQIPYIKDEDVIQIFYDTMNRIGTMALVHEKLYQTKNLSHIDLKKYFSDLVSLVTKSVVQKSDIRIRSDMENVLVSVDTAVPCGLIINELLSNSLKHGFPGDRSGEIHISLKNEDNGDVQIRVGDDGVGLPPNFDYRRVDSFGLKSAVALAEIQLGGNFSVHEAKGVEFRVRFKKPVHRKSV